MLRSGPVKPKLVARGSGATSSPWKRAVPTIGAEGVPLNLRPLLSYVLWRLHERETYSFAKDNSILVCDDKDTALVAQNLGIKVIGFESLRLKVQAQNKPKINVSVWGDVEREFGDIIKKTALFKAEVIQPNGKVPPIPELEEIKTENQLAKESENKIKAVEMVDSKDIETEKPKIEETQSEMIVSDIQQDDTKAAEVNHQDDVVKGETAEKETVPVTPRAWADVVSNRTRPVPVKPTVSAPKSQNLSWPTDAAAEKSKDGLMDAVAQEKASTIVDWVQKVKAAGNDPEPQRSPPNSHKKPRARKAKEPTPPPEEPPKPFRPILMQRTPNSSQIAFDKGLSPPRTPSAECVKNGGSFNHTPNASISSVHSLSAKAQSSNTPDSAKVPSSKGQYEKGTSIHEASGKAPSLGNRAMDEPEDSDDEVVVFNPRAKRMSAQQAPKQVSPEKAPESRGQESKAAQLPAEGFVAGQQQAIKQPSPDRAGPPRNRRQPKPRAPVVIDPDAFGRDFASNPRPHRHVPHPRVHPRPNSQHGPAPQRPTSQHGTLPNGVPPQRPVSQHGPPRPHPRGGRHQQGHLPPHYPTALNGQNGSVANTQNGQKKPNGLVMDVENGKPVNGVNGQSHPVSGGSPRQEPQPDKAGPDVDFVLKSGSLRGSTRGRGKLWIP